MVKSVMVLALGATLFAQRPPVTPAGTPVGPDLSGRWNRESVSGEAGAAEGSMWGSRVEIGRAGSNVTVRTDDGKPQQFRPDGSESAEVLSIKGCANQTRITKYEPAKDRVTITTWLAIKTGCFHGEFEDEPFVYRTGPIEMKEVMGSRRLESVTVVFRDGDVLRVDSTRNPPAGGGPLTSSTTIYRR